VVNRGHRVPTESTVTFQQSTTGKRLGHCTCADFNINQRLCKHVRVAAGLHLYLQRVRLTTTALAA
jgi:hypothetical protein